MRARTMVSVAVSACVALVACACGPEQSKENAAARPSPPSTSTQAEEPAAMPSVPARTEEPSAEPTGKQPGPMTTAGTIQRYEQYLHALGREDIRHGLRSGRARREEGAGPRVRPVHVDVRSRVPDDLARAEQGPADRDGRPNSACPRFTLTAGEYRTPTAPAAAAACAPRTSLWTYIPQLRRRPGTAMQELGAEPSPRLHRLTMPWSASARRRTWSAAAPQPHLSASQSA